MDGGPPRFPQGSSCPVVLRILLACISTFVYGAITPSGRPFQCRSTTRIHRVSQSYNPAMHAQRFRLFPFRSPLLRESLLISSPGGTLDVSIPSVSPRYPMYSDNDTMALTMVGSPIRSPPDHSLLAAPRGFSQLTTTFFAFLVPRHPPLALFSLDHTILLHTSMPIPDTEPQKS